MIGYLSGKILAFDDTLILDVGGVGYEIFVGKPDHVNLGSVGDELTLWIHTYVREDQISLFGFKESLQKKIFLILNGISGIGPKLAMAATTLLSPTELVDAITLGNTRTLKSIPGVGKKMADRMVLELKDKLGPLIKAQEWAQQDSVDMAELAVWADLREALGGLGFSDQKIGNVVKLLRKELDGDTPPINELLKLGLQKIKQC